LAGYGVVAFVIVSLSPALIRLTWPTTTLPAGPLRDRLEGLSERLDFRFTDILLWETGGSVINAGVTGALPWFRYVLLTDALVANLEPRQVEAVFGHEVGHVAHRHLAYFATFFLGSFGVMALVVFGIDRSLAIDGPLWLGPSSPWLEWVLQSGAALGLVAGYFAVVFGVLSRRLERQADVFGCRSVSCGRLTCPPHLDVNVAPERAGDASGVCPVGVRTFIEALTAVAAMNGIDPASRSWRHGSISGRIAFLERLELRPETERAFQRQTTTFRVSLVTFLGVAVAVAYWIGALAEL
jgi:STE24 endopeptidase